MHAIGNLLIVLMKYYVQLLYDIMMKEGKK